MNIMELFSKVSYQKVEQAGFNLGQINDVQTDSRKVKQDDVFVCLEGEHVDGHAYIAQAIQNGASLIFIQKEIPLFPKEDVTIVRVSSTYRTLAEVSSVVYGNPTSSMKIIGVTGTNGKTSVTTFLNQLYRNKGYQTGLIGTMHNDIAGTIYPTENTTPFAHDLQRMFRDMKNQDVSHVFMEVSSHGLAMGRVWGCAFDYGVLTNLSQDHLDYHGTMDEYKRAKGLLFTSLGNDFAKTAVLNADDETFSYYQSITGCRVLSYGIKNEADIKGSNVRQEEDGLAFTVTYKEHTYEVYTALTGSFHVYNLLGAMAVCLQDGWDIDSLVEAISQLRPVQGRMEPVRAGQPFDVIVDFAHTPDGLENALQSAKRFAKGRVLTLIGCGGNRDKGKRPIMARVAEQYSDYVYLTSDNPRHEEPLAILKDMEKGMTGDQYTMYVDRKRAIREIIHHAEDGDVVILAGKGHETYQIIGDTKTHFSDKEVAEEVIREWLPVRSLDFDEGFPDGVYVIPSSSGPRIKVRALYEYCKENALHPSDLTEEESKQFLGYPKY